MRTNKTFLELCYNRAMNAATKAKQVNTALRNDYFITNPKVFVDASQQFRCEAKENTVLEIKQKSAEIKKAMEAIPDIAIRDNLVSYLERFKDNVICSHDDPNRRYSLEENFLNLFLSVRVPWGAKTEDVALFNVGTTELLHHRPENIKAFYQDNECNNFCDWLIKNGYYKPSLKVDLTDVSNSYSSRHNEKRVENIEITDRKLVNIVKTARKLSQVIDVLKSHKRDWYKHTTIAKCQDDPVVWPIIEKDQLVIDHIEAIKERAVLVKEERERKLREQREAAAAQRKAQLEAIENGEEIEIPEEAPKLDKSHANLVRAINRLGSK